jgi:hypothetical protein
VADERVEGVCPLVGRHGLNVECLRERCQWWVAERGVCVLVGVVGALLELGHELALFVDLEGQGKGALCHED